MSAVAALGVAAPVIAPPQRIRNKHPHMLAVLSFGLVPQSAPAATSPAGLLDPLALVANKGSQTTTRRPYLPPAENQGLHTATLALG